VDWAFKRNEDMLKEHREISEEHKRMIERLEDAQELHNIKIDELNLEVESLKRCLSNTGKRKWTNQIKNTVARKWPNRRKAGYTQVKVLMIRWNRMIWACLMKSILLRKSSKDLIISMYQNTIFPTRTH